MYQCNNGEIYLFVIYDMTYFLFFGQKAPKHIFPSNANVISGMYMYVMIWLYLSCPLVFGHTDL